MSKFEWEWQKDLREKDAEIERLHQLEAQTGDLIESLNKQHHAEIERLKVRLEESYAKQTYKEWERNKQILVSLNDKVEEQSGLITELADVLFKQRGSVFEDVLIQRARASTVSSAEPEAISAN